MSRQTQCVSWESGRRAQASASALHTFITGEGRARFAAAAASCLPAAGLGLDISGSADTPDDPVERLRLGFPRLSASELVAAVEPYFENGVNPPRHIRSVAGSNRFSRLGE
jgi:hypothetical protein